MIAQNEINEQKELINKTDYRTVPYKQRAGRILVQIKNGECTIITDPTVEVKHSWQVYVTGELKIKLFCFFTVRTIVWVFKVAKNK